MAHFFQFLKNLSNGHICTFLNKKIKWFSLKSRVSHVLKIYLMHQLMRDQHDVGAESPESSKNASCSSHPRYSLRPQLRRHEFFLRTQTSTILSQSQVITTLLPAPLYNAQYRNQSWPDLLEPPMGASKTTPALPLRIQGLLTSSGATESLAS